MMTDIPNSYLNWVQKRCEHSNDRTLEVWHIGNGCQCGHQYDLIIIFRPLRAHHKECSRPLRMADVLQSRKASLLQYIVDHGGHIDYADFVPWKWPETFAFTATTFRIVFYVTTWVAAATCIAHPHIVSLVGQNIRESMRWSHNNPRARRIQQSMHQKYRLFSLTNRTLGTAGNPMQFQYVAITCC